MDQSNDKFQPLCGTGTLRAKPTPHAVIRSGQISLPNVGQCFIDGNHSRIATSAELDIKNAETRKVVAKLLIPISHDEVVHGTIVVEPYGRKRKREVWKVVATLRRGEAGPYRALRLPDVQISHEQREEAFGSKPHSKYAVA